MIDDWWQTVPTPWLDGKHTGTLPSIRRVHGNGLDSLEPHSHTHLLIASSHIFIAVFGRVVKGMDVCTAIENVKTDKFDKPMDEIRIHSVDLE